jgi:hypothetical protein
MGDTLDFVDCGIGDGLHAERIHSYPGNRRHRLAGNQAYPEQKNILAIWPLAGEGGVWGKEG